MLQSDRNILDHETQKSGVYYKRFDESSRLTELFLHAGSDWIISGLITNLPCACDICWMSSCTC